MANLPLPYTFLRTMALAHLNGTCTRLVASATPNSLGNVTKRTYTPGLSTDCGFGPIKRGYSPAPILKPTETNQIRLPLSFVITNLDRIRLDTLHGTAVSVYNIYEIVGDPVPGPTLRLFTIRLVTDGTS